MKLLTHSLIDIKGDNILQEIEDKSILENFAKAEMDNPSPRKFINGATVYASRRLELPRTFGRAVLSDFGSAVRGDEKRNHDAQPNVYRSPEVMLKTEWSYPVDIWNVGVMVHLFIHTQLRSFEFTNHVQIRSGIFSRASTCFTAMILMGKGTQPARISLS